MTYLQMLDMAEQAAADQLAWHRANALRTSEAEFQAFEIGFRDGWRKAVSALKLHAKLDVR